MSILSRSQLTSVLTTNITTPLNKQNTATKVIEVLQDIIDSQANTIDDVSTNTLNYVLNNGNNSGNIPIIMGSNIVSGSVSSNIINMNYGNSILIGATNSGLTVASSSVHLYSGGSGLAFSNNNTVSLSSYKGVLELRAVSDSILLDAATISIQPNNFAVMDFNSNNIQDISSIMFKDARSEIIFLTNVNSNYTVSKLTSNKTISTATPFGITDLIDNLRANYVATCGIQIIGFSTQSGHGYGRNIRATFKSIGGTVSMISSATYVTSSDFATASAGFTISAAGVGIEYTGEPGDDITWSGISEILKQIN